MRTLLLVLAVSAVALAQDHEKQARAARKRVKADPTDVASWLKLADALVAMGEPHDAWTDLESAIEANPKEPRLFVKLGDVFMKVAEAELASGGDGTSIRSYYMDAERMYDAALALDPKIADAMYGKAAANFQLSESADRKAKARKAVADTIGLDPKHAKAYALQAFMFYGDGNTLRRQGKEQTAREKFRAAAMAYETALRLDKSNPLDFVRYGHCFYALGKTDEAKKAYLAGIQYHPEDATAITSGLYYVAKKNWRTAGPLLEEAVKISPKCGWAWFYLGYSRFLNDELDPALDAFTKAQKLVPDYAETHFYAGYTLEKKNDARGALANYRKALKAQPGHKDTVTRFQNLILQNSTDIDRAEKLFEDLLAGAPENGWIRNDYALLLRNWAELRDAARDKRPAAKVAKRIKRSGEVYEEAAALLPDEAQIQSDCGLLFQFYPVNRDPEKAKRYFTRSLNLQPTYRDAFDGLTRICTSTRDWELLADYAETVLDAIDGGRLAVAPVRGQAPRELANETPGLKARAARALAMARKHLPKDG